MSDEIERRLRDAIGAEARYPVDDAGSLDAIRARAGAARRRRRIGGVALSAAAALVVGVAIGAAAGGHHPTVQVASGGEGDVTTTVVCGPASTVPATETTMAMTTERGPSSSTTARPSSTTTITPSTAVASTPSTTEYVRLGGITAADGTGWTLLAEADGGMQAPTTITASTSTAPAHSSTVIVGSGDGVTTTMGSEDGTTAPALAPLDEVIEEAEANGGDLDCLPTCDEVIDSMQRDVTVPPTTVARGDHGTTEPPASTTLPPATPPSTHSPVPCRGIIDTTQPPSSAPTTGTSMPAADRAAIDQITDAFVRAFDASTPTEERFALVEDGGALAAAGDAAAAKFPEASRTITAEVRSVRLDGDDRAAVTFELLYDGAMALGPQEGEAVRIDGRWKVSRATRCAVIQQAGVTCPASEDGP